MVQPEIRDQPTWDVWNPVNNGINCQPQLVLVVFCTIIYTVFYTSQVVVWDFWTINSMKPEISSWWITTFWHGQWLKSLHNYAEASRSPKQPKLFTRWWCHSTLLRNIFVKLDILPQTGVKQTKSLKPPPSLYVFFWNILLFLFFQSASKKTGWFLDSWFPNIRQTKKQITHEQRSSLCGFPAGTEVE